MQKNFQWKWEYNANTLELRLSCTNPSICNIFSCWLRHCATIDRKRPKPFQPSALVCHRMPQTNVNHAQVIAHRAHCQAVHYHNRCTETSTAIINFHINGLVQERCNPSALAMDLHLSCINASIYAVKKGAGVTIFFVFFLQIILFHNCGVGEWCK